MRKLLILLLLGGIFVFPLPASAQTNVTLSSVTVQLWPEYDQPNMLVLVDFQLAPGASLPVDLTFRIPQEATLIAVAYDSGNNAFINSPFEGPSVEGEWQLFSMTVDQNVAYRFEYYQPLVFNGSSRSFAYLWEDTYTVDAFQVNVLQPLDVSTITIDPDYASVETFQGLKYFQGKPVSLSPNQQYTLTLQYKKSTDTLVSESSAVQPAAPVNENTPGRVSLNNSLPYIIGGLGVIMILGGIVYYFQAGRSSSRKSRRRHVRVEAEAEGAESYCPQCGTRANPNDRFCRTCGTRLRHNEE